MAKRELAIIISDEGFFPNRVVAFEGESVRFFLTSLSQNDSCFVMKTKNVLCFSSIDPQEVFLELYCTEK